MGFFHGWLTELSKRFESIEVICLREGHHALPQNVRVHSLGKESGESRFKYITRFYTHIWNTAGSYDRVFVHMNPHYVLLGGFYWRARNIPIFFWRNHAKMNLMTRIAAYFSKNVFYTSPYACTSVFKHAIQMPVGVDATVFVPAPSTKEHTYPKKILFLGRLSPVKRVELFLEVSNILTLGYEFHLYGDDPSKEKVYEKYLRSRAGSHVFFHPAVRNEDTPAIYQAHDLYVNLTPEGSMDKTVLEAILCGIPTLVANSSFRDVLPESAVLSSTTPEHIADRIDAYTHRTKEELESVLTHSRDLVVEKHSLEKLATMLYNVMQ